MKIRVSIVIYRPDVHLLQDVVRHLSAAVTVLREHRDAHVHLDIVNNHPGDEVFAVMKEWLAATPLDAGLSVGTMDAPGNIGYGAANNLSIWQSDDSTYHLVLNPDVLLTPGALGKATDYLEAHPEVGLLVPKVLGFDGVVHHLCKRNSTLLDMFLRGFAPGFVQRLFAARMQRYLMLDCDYEQIIRPVQYPSGCFMFFRAALLRGIGGFDERFFMYLEDADIGRRVLQRADVVYVPEVVIYHKWTRGTHNDGFLRWVTVVSAFKYFLKWGGVY